MRINKSFKLENAVSSNILRPAMCNVKLENDKAIATDGHILAIVPIIREDGDTAVELSPSLLKEARKVKGPKGEEDVVLGRLNGTATLQNGAIIPNTVSGENFPNWEAVMPAADRPVVIQFAFDVEKLANLASALGQKVVVFTMNEPTQAIIVTAIEGSSCDMGQKGLLMPVSVKK